MLYFFACTNYYFKFNIKALPYKLKQSRHVQWCLCLNILLAIYIKTAGP